MDLLYVWGKRYICKSVITVFWGEGASPVLWHLSRAPLQEQAYPPAPRLDQLDGPPVAHVPGALAVYLDDLVSDLHQGDHNTHTHVSSGVSLGFRELKPGHKIGSTRPESAD